MDFSRLLACARDIFQTHVQSQSALDSMIKTTGLERRLHRISSGFVLFSLALNIILPASAQPRLPVVIVDMSEQTTLVEEVSLTGTVTSPRITQLSTEVSGFIESVSVDLGDRLSVSDEILRLNSDLKVLSLDAAKAATEQARQQLADAKRRLADAKRLVKSQNISASEYESLAAEVRIDSAELLRFSAEQQIKSAELERHVLKSPFDGVISRKHVEQGEWIQPGDPVVELVGLADLRIDFRAPQTVFTKLDKAAKIHIRLDSMPNRTFEAELDAIVPVTDPTTRTFLIRTKLLDRDVPLTPGMSASAILQLDTNKQGVVIHRDALTRYPDGRVTVWVIDENPTGDGETVSEQQVQTSYSFNGKIAIREGLAPGKRVVVQGNEGLRNGQKVIIKRSE